MFDPDPKQTLGRRRLPFGYAEEFYRQGRATLLGANMSPGLLIGWVGSEEGSRQITFPIVVKIKCPSYACGGGRFHRAHANSSVFLGFRSFVSPTRAVLTRSAIYASGCSEPPARNTGVEAYR
jgi:hypothetical protein